MPQKASHTLHILEGRATLYKRPTTPIWFVKPQLHFTTKVLKPLTPHVVVVFSQLELST